jgi:hypothetical protein
MAQNREGCRARAEECRQKAVNSVRNEDKVKWLRLAQDWLRLAESFEGLETRPGLKTLHNGDRGH